MGFDLRPKEHQVGTCATGLWLYQLAHRIISDVLHMFGNLKLYPVGSEYECFILLLNIKKRNGSMDVLQLTKKTKTVKVNVKAYTIGRKEGNVLFNDALNTFYLRLYGVTHMVKDHSDSERGNPLPPHRLLFLISSKGSFICIIPQTG